jgi:hypothetical protein
MSPDVGTSLYGLSAEPEARGVRTVVQSAAADRTDRKGLSLHPEAET